MKTLGLVTLTRLRLHNVLQKSNPIRGLAVVQSRALSGQNTDKRSISYNRRHQQQEQQHQHQQDGRQQEERNYGSEMLLLAASTAAAAFAYSMFQMKSYIVHADDNTVAFENRIRQYSTVDQIFNYFSTYLLSQRNTTGGKSENSEKMAEGSAAIATVSAAAGAISAGASLASVSAAFAGLPFAVTFKLEIENYTDQLLIPYQWKPHTGQIHRTYCPVKPGMKESMSGHKTANSATGCVGTISWKIGDTNKMLVVMYSVPYSHDWHSNWLGVGIFKLADTSNHYNIMYHNKESGFKRQSFYASADPIVHKDANYLVSASMGTTHKAEIQVQLYPQKVEHLANSLKKQNIKHYDF